MEWRLVASRGRESCRWQTADGGGWIALTLGAQGDITKVVVAASDGRSEVVEGYEQGLNLARRWRSEWRQVDPPRSSSSGPWLPPLPGRVPESYIEDATPPSYPPESIPQRPTVPSPETGRSSVPPLSPTSASNRNRSGSGSGSGSGTEYSPLSPAKTAEPVGSRTSQSLPPARLNPSLSSEDRSPANESRDRSWPPRTGGGTSSGRSVNRLTSETTADSDLDPHAKPSSDPPRTPHRR